MGYKSMPQGDCVVAGPFKRDKGLAIAREVAEAIGVPVAAACD